MYTFLVVILCGIAVWIVIDAYDRWVQPSLIRWRLSRWIDRYKAGKTKLAPRRSDYRISVNHVSFSLDQERPVAKTLFSVPWSDIARVRAFKRDRLTHDRICIAVEKVDGSIVEVDEDMHGWEKFTETLPTQLSGASPFHDWFDRVAFPPFETNLTDIYSRVDSPEANGSR